MQAKVADFAQYVIAGEAYAGAADPVSYDIPRWQRVLFSLVPRSLNYDAHRYMYQRLIRFYSDTKCTGCGVCENVCLSHKIELVDGKPVWRDNVRCYGCFACINLCPQQAIQIAARRPLYDSYTETNGRYHHPSVTWRDIAAQR
jgi:NAD-dependent dihydropyrimidine dehydrogenase PreA subunit